jgi:hypothetical protein
MVWSNCLRITLRFETDLASLGNKIETQNCTQSEITPQIDHSHFVLRTNYEFILAKSVSSPWARDHLVFDLR